MCWSGIRDPYVQLGLVVDGLATRIPGAAPGASDPLDPKLFSMPCRAMGLSVVMKLDKEPVARGEIRSASAG